MIMDERSEFADDLALNKGAPGTYVIADQIDLSQDGNLVFGEIRLVLKVGAEGINAAGDGTVAFQVVSADNIELTSNPEVHGQIGAFPTSATSGNDGGALAPGQMLAASRLPAPGATPYKRYLGIRQVTGGQAIVSGSIDAFFTNDPAAWRALGDNVN